MDIQYLFGVCGHFAPVVPCFQDRWSRKHHIPLPFCFGYVSNLSTTCISFDVEKSLSLIILFTGRVLPGAVPLELDLPFLCRGSLWPNCYCGRCCTNCFVLWLLLPIRHKRSAEIFWFWNLILLNDMFILCVFFFFPLQYLRGRSFNFQLKLIDTMTELQF